MSNKPNEKAIGKPEEKLNQMHPKWEIGILSVKIRSTVESLLTDTPNKGHCIKYLSTMDKTNRKKSIEWEK